jgi:hypothetical protein
VLSVCTERHRPAIGELLQDPCLLRLDAAVPRRRIERWLDHDLPPARGQRMNREGHDRRSPPTGEAAAGAVSSPSRKVVITSSTLTGSGDVAEEEVQGRADRRNPAGHRASDQDEAGSRPQSPLHTVAERTAAMIGEKLRRCGSEPQSFQCRSHSTVGFAELGRPDLA